MFTKAATYMSWAQDQIPSTGPLKYCRMIDILCKSTFPKILVIHIMVNLVHTNNYCFLDLLYHPLSIATALFELVWNCISCRLNASCLMTTRADVNRFGIYGHTTNHFGSYTFLGDRILLFKLKIFKNLTYSLG